MLVIRVVAVITALLGKMAVLSLKEARRLIFFLLQDHNLLQESSEYDDKKQIYRDTVSLYK